MNSQHYQTDPAELRMRHEHDSLRSITERCVPRLELGHVSCAKALVQRRLNNPMPHPALSQRGVVSGCRGFTLLELLVVILIIGLLTGIVAPRFLGQISRSETTTARAQLDAFDKALQGYRIDTGRFPTTSQGLKALATQPSDERRWRGPYMQGDIPLDPWGVPYQYRAPGPQGREYELLSYGKDRMPGGTGDDADISK